MRSTVWKATLVWSVAMFACGSSWAGGIGSDEYNGGLEALAGRDHRGASDSFRSLLPYAPSAAAYQGFAEANLNLGNLPAATWSIRNAELLGGTPTLGQLKRRTYADLPSDLLPLPLSGIDALAGFANRLPVPNLPSLLALLSFVLLAALLVRQISHRRDRSFETPWLAMGSSLAVGIVALWLAFRQNELVQGSEAVVFSDAAAPGDTLALRTAPSAGAPTERVLPLGTVVATGETLSGFTQVVLPTGEQGWLPTNRLWPIRPLEPTWPEPRR